MTTTNPIADGLVGALIAADPVAVAARFTDEARFRSLNPPGLHEAHGPAAIADLMTGWFSDCTDLQVLAVSTSTVVDRLQISYRFAGEKAGRGYCEIEQLLYATMDGDRMADVTLLCSGFRPTG